MVTTAAPPVGLLKEGQRITDPKQLRALMELARRYTLPGWEANQCELRRQYEGHLADSVGATMARRFPATAHRMPLAPLNLAAAVADNTACVYDHGADRCVLQDDEELPTDDPVAQDFADMIREAQLDVVMPEADRRVSLTRTLFLHVRSDSVEAMALNRPPRTVVELFFPSDVMVIPHPMAPTILQAALQVLVRVAGGVESQTFVHWRRDFVIGPGGAITSLGVWRADVVRWVRTERRSLGFLGGNLTIDEQVFVTPLWDPYPLPRLPFVAMHRGIPSGAPYVDADRYLAGALNNTNASLMAEIHTVDHATAPVWVHKTNEPQPKNFVMAPGVKANIRTDEELTSEPQQSDLNGIRASNKELLDTLARTKRVSSDSFTSEGTQAPQSGTALRIKNIPREKLRRECVAQTVPMEEEELLPLMVEVHDYFRATSIAGTGRRYKCSPGDEPNYESPKETQDRLLAAVASDWIDDARAAVNAGYYKTREEAEAAISAIKAASAMRAAKALPLLQPGDGGGPGDANVPIPGGVAADNAAQAVLNKTDRLLAPIAAAEKTAPPPGQGAPPAKK